MSAQPGSTDASTDGLLKMAELAERSGVSAGTIKHYLRERVLGDESGIVRTSRNMAWYPADFVERIKLVKRLQEERFMPLRLIGEVMERGPQEAAALVEVQDRILDRALAAGNGVRTPRKEVLARVSVPANVLNRLAELGVLTPTRTGYDHDDLRIIESIASFRAGGYDERLGFTVFDTLRYQEALAPLVAEEVRTMLDRLAGEVSVDRAAEIIGSGSEPLRELIGAMHAKLLRLELERQRHRG